MVRLSNGVISKEAHFLHANIVCLIDEAVAVDQNFMSYPVVKRREILLGMAKKELAEMAPSGRVLDMVNNDTIGKIPLALQQLALAKQRAEDQGDAELAKQIGSLLFILLVYSCTT